MPGDYPPEVQRYIDLLTTHYREAETLETFDSLHLYPGEIAYPEGYYEARFFNLVGFQEIPRLRRNLGRRDAVFTDEVRVKVCEIYADGSTVLVFASPVRVLDGQAAFLVPADAPARNR